MCMLSHHTVTVITLVLLWVQCSNYCLTTVVFNWHVHVQQLVLLNYCSLKIKLLNNYCTLWWLLYPLYMHWTFSFTTPYFLSSALVYMYMYMYMLHKSMCTCTSTFPVPIITCTCICSRIPCVHVLLHFQFLSSHVHVLYVYFYIYSSCHHMYMYMYMLHNSMCTCTSTIPVPILTCTCTVQFFPVYKNIYSSVVLVTTKPFLVRHYDFRLMKL